MDASPWDHTAASGYNYNTHTGENTGAGQQSHTTSYKQTVWSSGLLTNRIHTVKITWLGAKSSSASGTTVNLDAVDVIGTLR